MCMFTLSSGKITPKPHYWACHWCFWGSDQFAIEKESKGARWRFPLKQALHCQTWFCTLDEILTLSSLQNLYMRSKNRLLHATIKCPFLIPLALRVSFLDSELSILTQSACSILKQDWLLRRNDQLEAAYSIWRLPVSWIFLRSTSELASAVGKVG